MSCKLTIHLHLPRSFCFYVKSDCGRETQWIPWAIVVDIQCLIDLCKLNWLYNLQFLWWFKCLKPKLTWYSSVRRPKMVVLGSREQLCIHDDVKLLRGKTQTNACRVLCRRRGKRQCSHLQKVPGNFAKSFSLHTL